MNFIGERYKILFTLENLPKYSTSHLLNLCAKVVGNIKQRNHIYDLLPINLRTEFIDFVHKFNDFYLINDDIRIKYINDAKMCNNISDLNKIRQNIQSFIDDWYTHNNKFFVMKDKILQWINNNKVKISVDDSKELYEEMLNEHNESYLGGESVVELYSDGTLIVTKGGLMYGSHPRLMHPQGNGLNIQFAWDLPIKSKDGRTYILCSSGEKGVLLHNKIVQLYNKYKSVNLPQQPLIQ